MPLAINRYQRFLVVVVAMAIFSGSGGYLWAQDRPISGAVAALPVVSNVSSSQRTDGSGFVDIFYDLADADGDASTVSVIATDDDGVTWDVPVSALTGDVGPGIAPGANKYIVWDSAADLPGQLGTFRVRVCAADTPVNMVLIPGGTFQMGDTFNEGYSSELPVHSVYLSPYYINKYEVTNYQYATALNWANSQGNLITVTDGVVYKYGSGTSYSYCDTTTSSSYSQIIWNNGAFSVVPGKHNHPMVQVTWYGSVAFCNWRSAMEGRPQCYNLSTWTCDFGVAGYRLPTEAEWEKAARGGASGRRFPWSDTNTIQHARANYYSSSSYAYDTSPTREFHPTFNTGIRPYTSPAGYFAPNGYGVYAMAGNVWEWCNDWYSSSYYSVSPGSNPTGPGSGSYRVLRGGGWSLNAYNCRCAARSYYGAPGLRLYRIGFRLVLDSE